MVRPRPVASVVVAVRHRCHARLGRFNLAIRTGNPVSLWVVYDQAKPVSEFDDGLDRFIAYRSVADTNADVVDADIERQRVQRRVSGVRRVVREATLSLFVEPA